MERYLKDWIYAHKLEIYFSEIVGIDNQYADGKIQRRNKVN